MSSDHQGTNGRGTVSLRTTGVVVLVAVLSVAAVLLALCHARDARRMHELESQNRLLTAERTNANRLAVAIGTGPSVRLGDSDAAALQSRGLADPVEDIVADLQKHPELIPFEGHFGGTMDFYDGCVLALTDRWVLASFEDGHNDGYILLRFDVGPDGDIRWERLAAYEE